MLIDCPDCAVRYEVGDAELPPGRRTRCVRCGRVWTPNAILTPPAPDPLPSASAPAPSFPAEAPRTIPVRPMPPLPPQERSFPPIPPPAPPRRRSPLRTVGTIGVVVLVAVAFIALRAQAEAVWPPIARLYGALGLG